MANVQKRNSSNASKKAVGGKVVSNNILNKHVTA